MKHIILTIFISAVTGVAGYFLGSGQIERGGGSASAVGNKVEKVAKRFESEVVFEINPFGQGDMHRGKSQMLTRQFMQTQIAIIKSEETLSRAVRDYNLTQHLEGEEQDLIKQIEESVAVDQERGTDLMRLRVKADSELKAQKVAYAVLKTYTKRRIESQEKRSKEARKEFAAKRKTQEDIVEICRGKLFTLSKTLGIPYYGVTENAKNREALENAEELLPREKTRFGEVREEYERELAILDAIKQAEFSELLGEDLERVPLILHQRGWSSEVAEVMEKVE